MQITEKGEEKKYNEITRHTASLKTTIQPNLIKWWDQTDSFPSLLFLCVWNFKYVTTFTISGNLKKKTFDYTIKKIISGNENNLKLLPKMSLKLDWIIQQTEVRVSDADSRAKKTPHKCSKDVDFSFAVKFHWHERKKGEKSRKKRKNGSLLPGMISCWRRHRSPVRQGGPIPTRRGRQSGLWEEERSVAPDKLVGVVEGGRRRRVDGGTRAEAGDAVFQGEEECRITGRYWFFSINAEASRKHTPDAAAAKVN